MQESVAGHETDLPQPPELMLVQGRLHAAAACPFRHLCEWHSVLPSDAEDLQEPVHMEGSGF